MNLIEVLENKEKKICGHCHKEIRGRNYVYSLIHSFYKHGKGTKCYLYHKEY